jgi:hypothetical protein
MLATPGPNGDAVLEAAVIKAAMAGLVAPRHHVVVLQQIHSDLCVKVIRITTVLVCRVAWCASEVQVLEAAVMKAAMAGLAAPRHHFGSAATDTQRPVREGGWGIAQKQCGWMIRVAAALACCSLRCACGNTNLLKACGHSMTTILEQSCVL